VKPKQIVLDKQSLIGIKIDKLCDFAENHTLLACDTLLYECCTTSESDRERVLHHYKRIMEAGGYYCSCSVGYLQYEGKYGTLFPWFLPDLNTTMHIHSKKLHVKDFLDSNVTEKVFQSRCNVSKKMFLDLSKKLKTALDLDNP
jgi:hypothetical protein